jgi:hypothetical protein
MQERKSVSDGNAPVNATGRKKVSILEQSEAKTSSGKTSKHAQTLGNPLSLALRLSHNELIA